MKHQSSIITWDLNATQTNWLKRDLSEIKVRSRGHLAGGEIENLKATAGNIQLINQSAYFESNSFSYINSIITVTLVWYKIETLKKIYLLNVTITL